MSCLRILTIECGHLQVATHSWLTEQRPGWENFKPSAEPIGSKHQIEDWIKWSDIWRQKYKASGSWRQEYDNATLRKRALHWCSRDAFSSCFRRQLNKSTISWPFPPLLHILFVNMRKINASSHENGTIPSFQMSRAEKANALINPYPFNLRWTRRSSSRPADSLSLMVGYSTLLPISWGSHATSTKDSQSSVSE